MRCMGGCEVMEKTVYDINFEDAERCEQFGKRVAALRDIRGQISRKVLGHDIEEEDWIFFDDMLTLEYKRMQSLLKLLEERAG